MKYIYCFTNLINGKKYIGSTINSPEKRYAQHLYHVNNNSEKSDYPLYMAIRKYGQENFKFEVLFQKECSEEEIRKIEKEYILKYNTVSPNGYNQTDDTRHPLNTPETYAKMSETKRNNAKRVAVLNLKKELISIHRSIIDCAEETGFDEKKIAACCRGELKTSQDYIFYWLDDNNNYIIPEYTGYTYKGKPGTTQIQSTSKAVCQLDLKTKQIIKEFDTIALAARETGADSSGIAKCCKGQRNSCGGYAWKYTKEELKIPVQKQLNKKVIQLDKNTGKKIAEYNSLQEAAIAVNGDRANISKVCHGQQKTSAGFKWKFKEEEND